MRIGPARFSRNMLVVARGGDLVLVNTVRLNDEGLAALDALGQVTDVIRIAAAHGRDDPFYKQRYGATVWDMKGQRYFKGIRWNRGATYFRSDHALDGEEVPPLPEGRLFHFGTTPPEAVLLLPHAGGTLVSGDSLQNWGRPAAHFNWIGRVMFGLAGFIGPHKLGKGWLDICHPDPERLRALFALPFANVIPAHGDPVIDDAPARYRPSLEAYAKTRAKPASTDPQ